MSHLPAVWQDPAGQAIAAQVFAKRPGLITGFEFIAAFLAAPTSTGSPPAGGAGALPATPAGYVTADIGGTLRKIAFY